MGRQFSGFCHGICGGFVLPDMGAQVIGADDDLLNRQACGSGKSADEG